jgi:CRP/FNR family transcriptional regulator
MNRLRGSAIVKQQSATCANCVLPELCLRAGLPPEDVKRLDRLVYTRRNIKRGEELFRAGDPFSAIYAIRSGFFKSVLILENGRTQIMGFYMPGEVIGMDAINAGAYTSNAEALEDAEVCAIPLSRIDEFSFEARDLAHRLHQLMSKEMVRDRHVMVLLGGNKNAEARLAAFLVDVSNRFAARGYASSDLELPMTREDIGSFLGLQLATVSRTFSKLKRWKLIEVDQKHIRILDAAGLKQLL